jgi:hypothetical protein
VRSCNRLVRGRWLLECEIVEVWHTYNAYTHTHTHTHMYTHIHTPTYSLSCTPFTLSVALVRERLATAQLLLKKRGKETHTKLAPSDEFLDACQTHESILVLRLRSSSSALRKAISSPPTGASFSSASDPYALQSALTRVSAENERLRTKVHMLNGTVLEMQRLQRQQVIEFTSVLRQVGGGCVL